MSSADGYYISEIKTIITGTRIKRRYLSYWLSVPLNFLTNRNIPHFLLSVLFFLYLLLCASITYFVTQTILNLVFDYSDLALPISEMIGLFFLWRLDRSNTKLKLEVNHFRSQIEKKYLDEYKLYCYFLSEAQFDSKKFLYTKNIINNLNNMQAFRTFFFRAEKDTNLKITTEVLIILLRIHFNTDYSQKHNYSTEEVHPFFYQLLKVFKKENDSFFY
jgi:hypothetical protein